MFGSFARGEQDEDSDYDFLVEFIDPTAPGIFDRFFDLRDRLEDEFGAKVDLVDVGAIRNPVFKRCVDREKVKVYG